MLFISLVFSGIVLAATNAVAFATKKDGATCAAAVLTTLGCLFVAAAAFPAFLYGAALVTGVALVCGLLETRPRVFLVSSVVATVIPYGIIGWRTLATMREIEYRYPVVSIDDRLVYEQNRASHPALRDSDPQPSSPVVDALEDSGMTGGMDWKQHRRAASLKRLHEDTVQTFVNSSGFGVARMTRDHRDVVLKDIESIPQPGPQSDSDIIPAESRATLPLTQIDGVKPAKAFEKTERLQEFHTNSLVDFLNPAGFGYVKDRRVVAGFQEHHFSKMPGEEDRQLIDPWRLRRVELVSLLKHSKPCVYLSENLPRMDELRDAKVRPLDDFEGQRLPELLRGKDLVFEQRENCVHVLGAIRAAKQCLDCHDVQRGDLLGAFSYRLSRSTK